MSIYGSLYACIGGEMSQPKDEAINDALIKAGLLLWDDPREGIERTVAFIDYLGGLERQLAEARREIDRFAEGYIALNNQYHETVEQRARALAALRELRCWAQRGSTPEKAGAQCETIGEAMDQADAALAPTPGSEVGWEIAIAEARRQIREAEGRNDKDRVKWLRVSLDQFEEYRDKGEPWPVTKAPLPSPPTALLETQEGLTFDEYQKKYGVVKPECAHCGRPQVVDGICQVCGWNAEAGVYEFAEGGRGHR